VQCSHNCLKAPQLALEVLELATPSESLELALELATPSAAAQETRALAMPLPTMKMTALQRAATKVPPCLAAMGTPESELAEQLRNQEPYVALSKECCCRYVFSCCVQSQKLSDRHRRNCEAEI
jgi:hypothetical protein